ncbi:MAG: glucose-6-phosphate isomerase [Anaerolineae bacterium]|nr:glucose-6-phosphate isomerase [Anaerolineae bacterium]
MEQIAVERIVPRIWAHDHTVWQQDPAEIANRLGWLHIAKEMAEQCPRLDDLAGRVRADGYSDVLLLGMGGSSLAPEVFSQVLASGTPRLAVLDSTDPGTVLAHAGRLDPARTLFIVSSKSGSTVETLSFFKFFYNWSAQASGGRETGRHFVAITDPGSKLQALAERFAFRATFLNDPNIGGRYSALSYFGLVPAALAGVDVEKLLERALAMAKKCRLDKPGENDGAWLGAVLGELGRAGRDKATLIISPQLASFGDWVEQLVAESTGKDGRGILPVVGEPIGSPRVYGNDRAFVYLRLAGDDRFDAAVQALQDTGHPVIRLRLSDPYDLGGQFFLWEMATAIAGYRLGIHPFNQPDVEAAKEMARQTIADYRETGQLPQDRALPPSATALTAFLAQARLGDPSGRGRSYVALQAYVQPTPETDAALQALRACLRDRYKLATTVGYGPRFLHSTGQLHKGDGGNGLFAQFTSDPLHDAAIPDEAGQAAAGVTFGLLKTAQALGDKRALEKGGRPVIRFHLGSDPAGRLNHLLQSLQ